MPPTNVTQARQSTSPAKGDGVSTMIWIDGKWYDRSTATISVFDHGLLYGDGVFEGTRAYNGKVFKLKEHIARLFDSAHCISLAPPITQEELCRITEEGVRSSGLKDAYLRHLITRGVGDLGLDPRKCPKPSVIVIIDQITLWSPERYEQGLNVITAATPIPHKESLSPRVKSLNYLTHILAKIEGITAGADEILMMDSAGSVVEASGQNLFIVKNGELFTPAPYAGILKGITRDTVIELARAAGYPVHETILNRYDIYTADEAFLSGTATEIVPIRQLDGRTIGEGRQGRITRELSQKFKAFVRD
jgi:branched-chain amino acid aminotransferase